MSSLKRVVIAGMITAICIGYIGPVGAYLDQRSELERERSRLSALELKRDRLAARITALDQPAVLELRARELGLLRPGERAFTVTGFGRPRAAKKARGDERSPAPLDPYLRWISGLG